MLDVAMVFGAGLGTRMKELTKDKPKPLIEVNHKSLIDYTLDNLVLSGIRKVVVNSFYQYEKLENHLASYEKQNPNIEIVISREEERLETGGGIVKALKYLGTSFFTLNSDVILVNGEEKALDRLRNFWDPSKMDLLLLLQPLEKAIGYNGEGDFIISSEENGYLQSSKGKEGSKKYVYTGIQIIKSELFSLYRDGDIFSLSEIYKKFISKDNGRIRGLVHDSGWLHVGDKEGISKASGYLKSKNNILKNLKEVSF